MQSCVRHLIFVSSMSIYDEVPDKKHGGILDAHPQSASVIEASDLGTASLIEAAVDDVLITRQ